VTCGAIALALVIGLFAGLGRLAGNRVINGIASLYVEVIRGIPLLVQLFYIYYALGRIVNIPAISSAIIAMAVCYGAYMGEIFRAGIQSIPKGQTEAARSLGMNKSQTMVHVILPQAVTVILPPIGNEFVALLKDSSLVSILAVADLLRRGREFASETFTYFETYTMVALVYLIITLFFSKLVSIMEERISAGK
jgi:polar amino acid transport system permease protein